jgi:hypothetical protein
MVSECCFCCRGGSCQTQAKTSAPHSQGRARIFEKENGYFFVLDNFNSAPIIAWAFSFSTMEKSDPFENGIFLVSDALLIDCPLPPLFWFWFHIKILKTGYSV